MSGIVVRGLRKRFGPVQALDGLDLEVRSGEITCLLGRNGAGKSTLLRVLATTVLPDEGSATLAGHDVVAEGRAARRATGLVLGDERSWYWRLSGRANVEFFAALQGLSRAEARRRTAELLDQVQLTDAADRRFDGYSSGMRARLSLARALLVAPPVLLLDEPSQTLDPVVAKDFRQLVRSAADEGACVLWVTHDLHEAADVGDRVVVVHQGRVGHDQTSRTTAAVLDRVLEDLR